MKPFFSKLYSILTRHDKRFLGILIVVSILISLMEMVGVAVILPFVHLATDFAAIHENRYLHSAYTFFGFTREIDFVMALGIGLLFFYPLRSLLNLGYFYLLAKFANGRYHLLAYRLFENYLGMSYRDFTHKNASEITKTIITETNNLTALLSGLLLMLSEIFVVLLIYGAMLYVNWKITLLITLLLAANALVLVKTVSKRIKNTGIAREKEQRLFYTIIQKTLSNFKMMKLSSETTSLLASFDSASSMFAHTSIRSDTLFHVPRLFLEALGFGLIVFIIVFLLYKYQTDISGFLPTIAMFVVALYRLMPSANRILSGYNTIVFNKKSLDIIHNDLMYDPEPPGKEPIDFTEVIELHDVCFEYIEGKPILTDVSLTIRRGESIAFVGESGSGKSTLVDLIIGLYRPKSGQINIDGVPLCDANIQSWRAKIGYIPQSITLFDGTVAENVAFGTPIQPEKLRTVLRQADILDFLETQHQGIDTPVGDGGIKLSGGQRQRIAIARALYRDPEILVLDEATSALDHETEAKIMEEVYKISENKTLIVIAHRLSTIEKCGKVIHLQNNFLAEKIL